MRSALIANDDRLARFCELVQQGVDAWVEAGKLLCQLKKANPNIFVDIMCKNIGFSLETLKTFEGLGRGEIYPRLLLDGSIGARKLITLPYAEQERLMDAEIEVVVKESGSVFIKKKKLQELTKRDAEIAFNYATIRPVKEQMNLVQKHASGRGFAGVNPSESLEETAVVSDTINGNLSAAQTALLRARELMIQEKTCNKTFDRMFTEVLHALGNLRYELSQ